MLRDKYLAFVNKGIELLDNNSKQWLLNIDEDRLNMNHVRDCILGQWLGDYQHGLDKLGVKEAHHYGFDANPFLDNEMTWDAHYEVLEQVWKDRIAELRAERGM